MVQIGSLLLQIPLFLSNLTNPSPSPSDAKTTALTMDSQQSYTLPPLPYAYDALEPHISAQIMELHHSKHHQAYVTNLNAALRNHLEALSAGDVAKQIGLQAAIKFHGGGHINHSLFWPSLCPASSASASPIAAPALSSAITTHFGSVDALKAELKALLMSIQGSGWGWLVKNPKGGLSLVATKDQDPVHANQGIVIFGVDMWEHAYYLQYWNDKGKYVDAILAVLDWGVAEKRWFGERVGDVTV